MAATAASMLRAVSAGPSTAGQILITVSPASMPLLPWLLLSQRLVLLVPTSSCVNANTVICWRLRAVGVAKSCWRRTATASGCTLPIPATIVTLGGETHSSVVTDARPDALAAHAPSLLQEAQCFTANTTNTARKIFGALHAGLLAK